MADISALLANAAQTNAKFDLSDINTSYYKSLDEAYKRRTQDAFKEGVPIAKDGTPDWDKITSTLLQSGGTPAVPSAVGLLKEQTQLGLQRALQGMGPKVFSGDDPR